MHLSNGKQQSKEKGASKRQNQYIQIWQPEIRNATKKDVTKLAQQKVKKSNNTTARIAISNIIYIASPNHRKKEIVATNKPFTVAHAIDKILQKQNITS